MSKVLYRGEAQGKYPASVRISKAKHNTRFVWSVLILLITQQTSKQSQRLVKYTHTSSIQQAKSIGVAILILSSPLAQFSSISFDWSVVYGFENHDLCIWIQIFLQFSCLNAHMQFTLHIWKLCAKQYLNIHVPWTCSYRNIYYELLPHVLHYLSQYEIECANE